MKTTQAEHILRMMFGEKNPTYRRLCQIVSAVAAEAYSTGRRDESDTRRQMLMCICGGPHGRHSEDCPASWSC
jgi:hypothetical protein